MLLVYQQHMFEAFFVVHFFPEQKTKRVSRVKTIDNDQVLVRRNDEGEKRAGREIAENTGNVTRVSAGSLLLSLIIDDGCL